MPRHQFISFLLCLRITAFFNCKPCRRCSRYIATLKRPNEIEDERKHGEGIGLISRDILSRAADGASPVKAWWEHLNLTQADLAARLGINLPAYSEQESGLLRLRKTRKKKWRPHPELRSNRWTFEHRLSVSFATNPQKSESSARFDVTKPNALRFAGFHRHACAADPEKPMKSRAIKKLPGAVVFFALVSGGIGIGMATNAQAQSAAPADAASMIKPPAVPSAPNASDPHAYNPDNMPTKRPALPPNSNRMLHNNPASDAIAK